MKPIGMASLFGVGLGLAFTVFPCLVGGCGSTIGIFPMGYPTIDNYPAWSPDGSTILYSHNGITSVERTGAYHVDPESMGLWAVNEDGTNARLLVHAGLGGAWSDWSPDGEWIVYAARDQAAIYKARFEEGRVDTTSITLLTSGGWNCFPSWSPDGEWIAYDSIPPGEDDPHDLYVMRIDGTEKTRLSHSHVRMPDWSPDGQWIVHHRYLEGADPREDGDICIMPASGDSLAMDQVTRLTSGMKFDRYPKYSPDGTMVAFESDGGVWVVNSDGSDLRRITDGENPSWSPDSRKLAFVKPSDDRNDNGTIWIIRLDGSGLRRVTHGLR